MRSEFLRTVFLGNSPSRAMRLARAQSGADGLDALEGAADIAQAHLLRLQDEAEHVRGVGDLWPVDDGPTDVAAEHRDKSLGFEDAESLADGRLGHAELFDQLLLFADAAAIGDLTEIHAW